MRTCSVAVCTRPVVARGLCRAHYARLHRHGDTGTTAIQPRPLTGDDGHEVLLKAIRDFWNEHGYAPSGHDLMRACGVSSPSVIHYHLHKLKNAGLIAMEPRLARSIQVIGEPS